MIYAILIFFSFWQSPPPDRTVGLLSLDIDGSNPGLNLLYPHNQSNVYLLNQCGEIVHQWEDDDVWQPGNTAYLLDDGRLLKTKRHVQIHQDTIWAAGGGAIVELRSWENELIWQFVQNNSRARLHHDAIMLPSGHVLMISWEVKSSEEAVQAGRNPALLPLSTLWPDYLLEVNPENDEIVWEWHAWDHLIQDFNPTKSNYGIVGEHPELIDVNWDFGNAHPDWMHTNAVHYHEDLDQVMLTVPTFGEIWIIDHSTTVTEAAGHTGGRSGKGGDLLFRWGNPQTYRQGSDEDQTLFYPHNGHWIGLHLERSHPYYGKIGVFNNRVSPDYSTVNVFSPVIDDTTGGYAGQDGRWLPYNFDLTVTHPDTFQINSNGLSSVQFLPNQNLLICSGRWGYTFELSPDLEVVWEYKTPLTGGRKAAQGQNLSFGTNITFRMDRYPTDFGAFSGKDLVGKGYLESNPVPLCGTLTTGSHLSIDRLSSGLNYYPNPVSGTLYIEWTSSRATSLQIYDIAGKSVLNMPLTTGNHLVNVTGWKPGLYLLQVNDTFTYKLIIN